MGFITRFGVGSKHLRIETGKSPDRNIVIVCVQGFHCFPLFSTVAKHIGIHLLVFIDSCMNHAKISDISFVEIFPRCFLPVIFFRRNFSRRIFAGDETFMKVHVVMDVLGTGEVYWMLLGTKIRSKITKSLKLLSLLGNFLYGYIKGKENV